MEKHTDISVILPTYNRAHCIGEAVESVLSQSVRAAEIIVVDDGSTDDTCGVLHPFKPFIRYIFQSNRGVSAARNCGIRASRGTWLAFLDSDDLWDCDKLHHHHQAIQSYPDINAHVVNMYINRPPRGSTDLFTLRKMHALIGNGITLARPLELMVTCHFAWVQNSCVRRSTILETGLFREDMNIYEDLDFFYRLACAGSWAVSPRIAARVLRRSETDNLSDYRRRNPTQSLQTMLSIYTRFPVGFDLNANEKKALRKNQGHICRQLSKILLKNAKFASTRAHCIATLRKQPDVKTIIACMAHLFIAVVAPLYIRFVRRT